MRTTLSVAALISIQAAMTHAGAQTGSDFIQALERTTCTIPFDINAEGKAFHIDWGMDTAWDWDANVYRGIAHIGKENFATGRVSFQPNELVITNEDGSLELTANQKKALSSRIEHIMLTGVTEANINCDHEALNDNNGFSNYVGKPEEWYKLIKASVQYCEAKGLHIISVSPFNEPDYTGWGEGSMEDFLNICKLIKNDPYFNDVRVCGGNTLNCDQALPWYNYLKEYLDEGNTHQLAGSLANYASFFSTVTADGKKATGDELHNVGEAIVGANYGMTTGIWWGFDSRARGQFCKDSNHGVRLGYAEDGSSWTSGAVYRNDSTGEIHAYIGSSERQATNATYNFVSTAKDVYFNGYGPCRQHVVSIPGGTGYQKGQINAEKLLEVEYGEDVPQEYINGTYTIMNYYNRLLLSLPSSSSVSGTAVQCNTRKSLTTATQQQWVVKPQNIDGDCSYWTLSLNNGKNMYLDLLNWNLNSGASIIAYQNSETPGGNEQWFLKYAGDGFWYIINRHSNKALYSTSSSSGTNVLQGECPTSETSATTRKKYMWRFQPLDAMCNLATPKWANDTLMAQRFSASVRLNWNAISDTTVTYNILRAEKSDGEYNTIARSVSGDTYLDNLISQNTEYIYKVVPVAYNGTRGAASQTVEAGAKGNKTMIMQLQFDGTLEDNTINALNASLLGTEQYSSLTSRKKSGTKSFIFNSKNYFMEIPYSAVNLDTMTVACWVYWNGSSNWERVFDFGNGTDQYMFLTPSNGSEMRFVMKNGDSEQILSTGSKLQSGKYKHLAVTICPNAEGKVSVKLYVDGEETASNDSFTIKPSDLSAMMNYIGRSQFNADPYFGGYIDDFRVYNYALSADEVKAITTDLDEMSADLDEDSTGIDDMTEKNESEETARYTVSGVSTKNAKGVNIVRYSDGTTKKIINR